MYKSAIVNTRINPKLKTNAENILHKVGLSPAEAVRLFYTQICLHKGLPFEAKIPNKKTLKAMHDADAGKTHKAGSINEIFDELD